MNAGDSDGGVLDEAAFTSYADEPTGTTLAALVGAHPIEVREQLLARMEALFYVEQHWRIAQHLTMLHLDMLQPQCGVADTIRAALFANHAVSASSGHPLAQLLHARVSWARRVPWAVIHSCRLIGESPAAVASLTLEQQTALKRDLLLLEGMALAYLGLAQDARELMARAEEIGGVSVEALCQLLMSSRPDQLAALWAALRLGLMVGLAPRIEAAALRATRHGLVRLLSARRENAGG